MTSAKKSKEEGGEKKEKTKESSSKTPVKKTLTKKKDKNNDKKKNRNKILNGGLKESPEVSVVSPEQVQKETEARKELSKKPNSKHPNMNGSESSKTEKAKKRREVKEEADLEEGEDGTMCSFPMSRIKRIIKTEDAACKLPQDVVFLVNKAAEMFIEQFCDEAYESSVRDRKKSLAYKHLSSVVSKQRRFDFLSDFVPEQLKAEEALKQRKLAEAGSS